MSRSARKSSSAEPATPQRLSRERILAAALALIDERGVESLSMRELAASLGVFPAAIYWHVRNRNDLIAGAIELAMGGVLPDASARSWKDRIRSVLVRYREALHAHPHLAPVVSSQLLYSNAQDMTLLEQVIVALQDAGFADEALVDAYNVVLAAMAGFATLELSVPPREEPGTWATELKQRILSADPDKYPALVANLSRLADKAFVLRWSSGHDQPLDRAFKAWVEVIVAGLDARRRAAR